MYVSYLVSTLVLDEERMVNGGSHAVGGGGCDWPRSNSNDYEEVLRSYKLIASEVCIRHIRRE